MTPTVPPADTTEPAPPGPIHASAVAFGPTRGVLILGRSGRGKSTLAFDFIQCGAQLVADDRVILVPSGGALHARAPRALAGLIELRGLGILRLPARALARIALIVDLDAPDPARLPEPATRTLAGITLPCVQKPATGPFAAAVARYLRAMTPIPEGTP